MGRTTAIAFGLLLLGTSCAVVAGVDGDWVHDESPWASAGQGGVTSAGGSGLTASGTGGGGLAAGGAGGGSSTLVECDGRLRDISRDPEHCGRCGFTCYKGQYCSNYVCGCRPEFVWRDFHCVNPAVDPSNCGDQFVDCSSPTDLCEDGVCVSSCTELGKSCSLCHDTDTDELHCSGCQSKDECSVDDVCVGGSCREWSVGRGCTSCPCDDCDDNSTQTLCCVYPHAPADHIICVEGDTCPE
jgi:hypothetical protein